MLIRYMASTNRNFSELPLWRRAIIVVLIPFVLPVLLLIVLLLLLAMAWNSFAYSVHWLRWKVLGVPIPPMCPPPPGPTT
jgi:putative effector of murein hydrolase